MSHAVSHHYPPHPSVIVQAFEGSGLRECRRSLVLADTTGPLAGLARREVLVLADVENLSHGAADLGHALCYQTLGRLIRSASGSADLHAFFSRERGDETTVRRLTRDGWCAHPRDIEVADTARGRRRFANSDHAIAFGAGLLATQHRYTAIVIGTGDGALGCDLATAIRRHRDQDVPCLTLSLPGSTSWRLDAAANGNIDGNIEIGRDCLTPPRTSPDPAQLGRSASPASPPWRGR
jgi:hypothetical protein